MYDLELQLEIKEVKESGTFSGIAAVCGTEDLGGDVIDKGAFRKTINDNPIVPVLWQHKSDEVIGEGTLSEWQGRLLLKGKLDMDDPTAQKAHRKMMNGLVKGLSIGFQTIKSTWEDIEGRMIRHIQEMKLWEVSVVTFPMMPQAQVTRVKSADVEERVKRIEEQVSALSVRISTPASNLEPEPRKTKEPPAASIEPELIHSALLRLQIARD